MDRAQLARDTLAAVDAGLYHGPDGPMDIGAAVRSAIAGTRVVAPARAMALADARPRDLGAPAVFEVVADGAVPVSRHLAASGAVTVLNFASARNVGGGFLGGASAQEEDLCRCSALFRCLERGSEYYRANRAAGSAIYTDHAIWSPDVPFFRAEDYGWLPRPFAASVITSPAPNTSAVAARDEVEVAFHRRARQVLAIAAAEPPTTIVLGAWGCGAFGGDPRMAAAAFAAALEDGFARSFARVVFAVLVRGRRDEQNLEVFRARFGQAPR